MRYLSMIRPDVEELRVVAGGFRGLIAGFSPRLDAWAPLRTSPAGAKIDELGAATQTAPRRRATACYGAVERGSLDFTKPSARCDGLSPESPRLSCGPRRARPRASVPANTVQSATALAELAGRRAPAPEARGASAVLAAAGPEAGRRERLWSAACREVGWPLREHAVGPLGFRCSAFFVRASRAHARPLVEAGGA